MSSFKKVINKDTNNPTDILVSPSTYDGIFSSLSHIYKLCGVDKDVVSPTLFQLLATYKKGTRRVGASQKKDLGLKIMEGNKHLSFPEYKLLCECLLEVNILHILQPIFF